MPVQPGSRPAFGSTRGALRAWLAAYAAATSTDAAFVRILDAATAGIDDKPSRATVDSYREHLTRIFVLDPLPAWVPMSNPLKRLTVSPKHHLVDPALASRQARARGSVRCTSRSSCRA